jgi:hypothetical protein
MSARSRERWKRYQIIGQLRLAVSVLGWISEATHLTSATRKRASLLGDAVSELFEDVCTETKEPTELSAKKGT